MSVEKIQSAIIPKLGKAVTVLCTALLINVIYQPTKFLDDISYDFRVMSWTIQKVKINKGQ
jgi:hypothetical protein